MAADVQFTDLGSMHDARLEALRKRRDGAAWYAVIGVFMIFAGSFHVGFAVGGVLMVVYGIVGYIWWSSRLTRVEDPWNDAEIDAWERREMAGEEHPDEEAVEEEWRDL